MSQPPSNRWLPVAGGVMTNMALGTVYAFSAFMLPLEKNPGGGEPRHPGSSPWGS